MLTASSSPSPDVCLEKTSSLLPPPPSKREIDRIGGSIFWVSVERKKKKYTQVWFLLLSASFFLSFFLITDKEFKFFFFSFFLSFFPTLFLLRWIWWEKGREQIRQKRMEKRKKNVRRVKGEFLKEHNCFFLASPLYNYKGWGARYEKSCPPLETPG